jgi:hypothetical protein
MSLGLPALGYGQQDEEGIFLATATLLIMLILTPLARSPAKNSRPNSP